MSNYTTKAIIASLTGKSESSIESEWLNWTDSFIEERTNMTFFEAASETIIIDGNGLDMIELSKRPIIEITKISILSGGVETYEYSGDEIDTYFALYKKKGFIAWKEVADADPGEFSEGYKNIDITGKFGYSSVPEIVEELATLLTIRRMKRRFPELEIESEKIDQYSVSYKKNIQNIDAAIDELFDLLLVEEYAGLEISGDDD